MQTYNYIKKLRKRGEWCLINYPIPPHGYSKGLCGCGSRTPPPVKYRNRIIRRLLQRELEEVIQETQHDN